MSGTLHLRSLGRVLSLLVAFALALVMQAQRNCGTMEYLQQEIDADPTRGLLLDAIDQFTEQFTAEQEPGAERSVVTIPVVFHVVWRTTAENIPDTRVLAQLQQLNDDFARLNADADNTPPLFQGLAANTNVQFCLAQRDPSGNPTTGIVRRQTTVTSFSSNNNVKYTANGGSNAWPRDSYLNIWVCNLSNGLLGYAQFPGGTAATDGVVVLFSSVGSLNTPGTATNYNYGRTLTHEVGHWLNLRHIWGDATCGNDFVADTPVHNTSNGGCPSYPHYSTCSGNPVEMTMNYMDYTYDACMNMFSAGQGTRMQALFAPGGARVALLNSLGCVPPGQGTTCAVPSGLASSSVTTSSATVSWASVGAAVSYTVQYRPLGGSWTTVNTGSNSASLSGLSASTTYEWGVRSNCSSGSSAYSSSATFTTGALATCAVPGGLSTSSITSSSAVLSWNSVSGAASYDVQYRQAGAAWEQTTISGTTANFTGLAAATTYEWAVRANCTGSSSAFSSIVPFTTLAATGCTDTWESNNTTGTAPVIPVNTDIQALIGSSNDVDWYRFNNTSSQRRIRIDLSNLPADYDVQLYQGTNKQVGISQNGGTTNETIIYNTSKVGTYYIRVYGYNGAFNSSQCYTLRASISGSNFREGLFDVEGTMALDASGGLMNLYPNPATDKVMLDYVAGHDGDITLMIFDALGREVVSTRLPVSNGPATHGLPVDGLANGLYVLHIVDGEQRYQQRFMVQR